MATIAYADGSKGLCGGKVDDSKEKGDDASIKLLEGPHHSIQVVISNVAHILEETCGDL